MSITSRERIVLALQHKESDRLPLELGATESSGITGIAYNNLKTHLGITGGRTQIFDLVQQIAKVEPSVLKIIGSDAIPLLIEPKEWKPWRLTDGSDAEIAAKANMKTLENGDTVLANEDGTVLARCPSGGLYFDSVYHPLKDAQTIEDINAGEPFFESFDWPYYNDENFSDLRKKAQELYHETPYAIVGNLWLHLFAAGQDLRGYESFMIDLMLNKPLAHRMLSKQVEAYLPRIDRYLEAVGEYLDIIQVNDDLGSQNGPLVRPDLYREMIKPYHKRLWQYIKGKSGRPLLLHSCGSVYDLIPDIIDIGIDALNPVQVTAANMDTKKLKREFGKDLTFWGGGCDSQRVLPRGTVNEVKDEVRRRVEDLAPGGGFVFCQVHNIQPDVPVKNIVAMYEELGNLC